jgi:hypothetical protein
MPEVIAQALNDLGLASFGQPALHFVECEVHNIVVVQLLRRNQIAETQPELVNQTHFV